MNTIEIKLPIDIIGALHPAFSHAVQKYTRNGIILEKGAELSDKRIEKNRGTYEFWYDYFFWYPDRFLNLIKPRSSRFHLFLYQRIFLRACVRYPRVCCIACRAFSKSFLSVIALYLMCIFRPGTKVFLCGPGKAQSAKIANEKIHELWRLFPLLKNEIIGEGNFRGDYCKLTYYNKSIFDVVTPIGSTRGGRRNAGIIDEFRDHNADDINEIVIPLLNVNRVTAQGDVNPNEPQQCQIWISSASDKNSFCYDKTIELLETAIINPSLCFIMGCDVSVPESVGLISKKFVNELKASPTFNEQGFAKEYLSRFVGSSEESWFSYDKFAVHRRLLNPETHNKIKAGDECFYIISVDVRVTKTVRPLQLY